MNIQSPAHPSRRALPQRRPAPPRAAPRPRAGRGRRRLPWRAIRPWPRQRLPRQRLSGCLLSRELHYAVCAMPSGLWGNIKEKPFGSGDLSTARAARRARGPAMSFRHARWESTRLPWKTSPTQGLCSGKQSRGGSGPPFSRCSLVRVRRDARARCSRQRSTSAWCSL